MGEQMVYENRRRGSMEKVEYDDESGRGSVDKISFSDERRRHSMDQMDRFDETEKYNKPNAFYKREKIMLIVGICCTVAAVAMLIVFGVVYTSKHWPTRLYWGTTCRVVDSKFTALDITCGCPGIDCRGYYPCLEVHVDYNDRYNQPRYAAELYHDYEHMYDSKKQAPGGSGTFHYNCAWHWCDANKEVNTDKIKEWQDEYGIRGSEYPCYYNPEDFNKVVIYKVTDAVAINVMIWPGLLLVAGIILIVFAIRRRVCL
ncbi:unnamed protein product [Owenia fusiformis]|uniref:Uncharacterized protein n=1 Tax=Owenia fusiformis TaxID=6347 RepID=A0A8S4N171_OWEFU|nr:unnamed protein product [Owenia fusiformis]